jgi:hypothetical protein
MDPRRGPTRRDVLVAATTALTGAAPAPAAEPAGKVYRIGVISASIHGKPQPRNGHTWHFAQYLHPAADLDALAKYVDPGTTEMFRKYVRNPKYAFDQLPFPDTKITRYYDADPKAAGPFTEAFPGVRVAHSLEELVEQVDAVCRGEGSGVRGMDCIARAPNTHTHRPSPPTRRPRRRGRGEQEGFAA